MAQAAALKVGEDRLNALMNEYGDDVMVEAIAELRTRAATQMRARFAIFLMAPIHPLHGWIVMVLLMSHWLSSWPSINQMILCLILRIKPALHWS